VADTFICYARVDQDFALKLRDCLVAYQRQPWIDLREIPPTAEWWEEIRAGIEVSDSFLFIVSSDSCASQECRRELSHAEANGKRLIPIIHRPVRPEELPRSIAKLQWVSFFETPFDSAAQSLLQALSLDLEFRRSHTAILLRALQWDQNTRDLNYLLRGTELQHAIEWLAKAPSIDAPRPVALQDEFIGASRECELKRSLVVPLATQTVELTEKHPELGETAALLAYQAHVYRRATAASGAEWVDKALRTGLSTAHLGGSLPVCVKRVYAISFSSTGRWLAVGGQNGNIEIWDLTQCDAVVALLRGREPQARTVLTGENDVLWLAFGSKNKAVIAVCGKPAQFGWHSDTPYSGPVVLWPDRASADVSSTVIGRARLVTGPGGLTTTPLFAIACSPDNRLLAYWTGDDVQVIDLMAATKKVQPTQSDILVQRIAVGPCRTLAFTDDNSALIVVELDGRITITGIDSQSHESVEILAGGCLRQVSSRDSLRLPAVALNANGKKLAISRSHRYSGDHISVCNLGAPTKNVEHGLGGIASCRAMVFAPDSESLVVSGDSEIRAFDVRRPGADPLILRSADVQSLALNSAGDLVAAGGDRVRLWRMRPAEATCTIVHTYPHCVRTVVFSPDRTTLASCGGDRTVGLHSFSSDEATIVDLAKWQVRLAFRDLDVRQKKRRRGAPSKLGFPLTFCDHGQRLSFALVQDDGEGGLEKLSIWDMCHLDTPRILLAPRTTPLWGTVRREPSFLATIFHGKCFLTSLDFDFNSFSTSATPHGPIRNGVVRRWDLTNPGVEPKTISEVEGVEPVAAFSPDGVFLASGTNGYERGWRAETTLGVWDLSMPSARSNTLGRTPGFASSIAYSGDGRSIALGTDNGEITIWDLAAPVRRLVLRGHGDQICTLAFSPDGAKLASGSEDQTIRVWDLREPEDRPVVLKGHRGGVASLAFGLDGRVIASGGEDGTVRVWITDTDVLAELTKRRVGRSLTVEEWREFIGQELEYEP